MFSRAFLSSARGNPALGAAYLYGDFSQNAEGSMCLIDLPINVKERVVFGAELAVSDHLGSIESFAHGNCLKVLNIIFEEELIILGREDSATKILYSNHVLRY
jgi:hypothetical protein